MMTPMLGRLHDGNIVRIIAIVDGQHHGPLFVIITGTGSAVTRPLNEVHVMGEAPAKWRTGPDESEGD